jgi:hypothetical protein
MAITTRLAALYYWKQNAMAVLCVVFAAWGAYDLWVKIPDKQQRFERYEAVKQRIGEFEATSAANGGTLPAEDTDAYNQANAELKQLTADAVPDKPSAYDKPTQWLFIACILFVPMALMEAARVKRRTYTLDDDGTLHCPAGTLPSADWRSADIADIDMGRWMAKSIAWLVHTDGTRIKLDDYKHKDLYKIIGVIANRLHPDQWTIEAKPVKPEEPADDAESGEPSDDVTPPPDDEASRRLEHASQDDEGS